MNKWQVDEKEFNKYVAARGENYAADNMDLVFKDAGTYGGSVGPCRSMFLHAFAAGGDAKRGPTACGPDTVGWRDSGFGWESDSGQIHKDGIMITLNGHVIMIDLHDVPPAQLRGCKECDCNVTHAHFKPIDKIAWHVRQDFPSVPALRSADMVM